MVQGCLQVLVCRENKHPQFKELKTIFPWCLFLGAKWQYRRKILTKSFHFSILQTFVGIFNSETDNLVNSLKKCPSEKDINILEPITEFTLNSIGGKSN